MDLEVVTRKIPIRKINSFLVGIPIPAKMKKELDIKEGDYVIPFFMNRDDGKADDEFGNRKLVFIFFRNKSGKIYNPHTELESDKDV